MERPSFPQSLEKYSSFTSVWTKWFYYVRINDRPFTVSIVREIYLSMVVHCPIFTLLKDFISSSLSNGTLDNDTSLQTPQSWWLGYCKFHFSASGILVFILFQKCLLNSRSLHGLFLTESYRSRVWIVRACFFLISHIARVDFTSNLIWNFLEKPAASAWANSVDESRGWSWQHIWRKGVVSNRNFVNWPRFHAPVNSNFNRIWNIERYDRKNQKILSFDWIFCCFRFLHYYSDARTSIALQLSRWKVNKRNTRTIGRKITEKRGEEKEQRGEKRWC